MPRDTSGCIGARACESGGSGVGTGPLSTSDSWLLGLAIFAVPPAGDGPADWELSLEVATVAGGASAQATEQ